MNAVSPFLFISYKITAFAVELIQSKFGLSGTFAP